MSWNLNKERLGIVSFTEAICLLQQAREDYIVGMTSGGFDLLHRGHLRYIQYLVEMTQDRASRQSKIPLVAVAINSDESIRANKGSRTNNRPVFNQVQRAELVAGLWGINLAFIFDCDEQLQLFRPHIFLASTMSDHRPDQRPEIDYFRSRGVKILIRDQMVDDSTTAILERIHKYQIR